jgi:hypothetical protein
VRTSNDVASSQGVFVRSSREPPRAHSSDHFNLTGDTTFQQDGVQTRRVEPRNAPTMINSVFNFRNFWDGRATYLFNGVSPFGAMDTAARVYRTDATGVPQPVQVRIGNASLASLATGPALSDFEMSAIGRTWPEIGPTPAHSQTAGTAVGQWHGQRAGHRTRPLRSWPQRSLPGHGAVGLPAGVVELEPRTVTIGGRSYSQAEANFSLFFGLAIQMYGATLVSTTHHSTDSWRGRARP